MPTRILYDNTKIAVARILGGEERQRTRAFSELQSYYLFGDRSVMLPLPAAPYEACEKISARVSSLSLVRYRSNDYSVPTQYGHRQVWVKG